MRRLPGGYLPGPTTTYQDLPRTYCTATENLPRTYRLAGWVTGGGLLDREKSGFRADSRRQVPMGADRCRCRPGLAEAIGSYRRLVRKLAEAIGTDRRCCILIFLKPLLASLGVSWSNFSSLFSDRELAKPRLGSLGL